MTNDLMQKLATAKKIMDKVDSGDYEKGNIDKNFILNDPENLLEQTAQQPVSTAYKKNQNPPSIEKINNSKLPQAIKQAMIENPIPSISLNDTTEISMDIIKGAKRLIEQDEISSKQPKSIPQKSFSQNISTTELVTILTPIIENIVRKTITEILDNKITQILTAQETKAINENLVLKVGDSIFKGKITGVKKN